jgi:hypothetical protein
MNRRNKIKLKETSIGSVVSSYLENNDWECWKEVEHNGRVADIVAVKFPLTVVVECKTTLNMDVMEQAERWMRINNAHSVYVAVPYAKGRDFAKKVLKRFGIGLITCYYSTNGWSVKTEVSPAINRKAKPSWGLLEEQKTSVAGTFGGGHITPWKLSINNIRMYLSRYGPTNIKDVLKNTGHHWKNDNVARYCLLKQISCGIIDDITIIDGIMSMR